MPEQLEKFIADVKQFVSRLLAFLSPQQKRLIFIGLPVFGSLAYAAFFLFDRMNYGPLYANVSPQDGAAIIKELEAEKIPYSISGSGAVIEVPRGDHLSDPPQTGWQRGARWGFGWIRKF